MPEESPSKKTKQNPSSRHEGWSKVYEGMTTVARLPMGEKYSVFRRRRQGDF